MCRLVLARISSCRRVWLPTWLPTCRRQPAPEAVHLCEVIVGGDDDDSVTAEFVDIVEGPSDRQIAHLGVLGPAEAGRPTDSAAVGRGSLSRPLPKIGNSLDAGGMSTLTAFHLDALPASPGDALRERRIELGLTQAELADLSGIAEGDISKIENGHLDERWSTIKRLSDALASVKEPTTSLANGGDSRTTPDVSGLEPWKPTGKARRSITVVE